MREMFTIAVCGECGPLEYTNGSNWVPAVRERAEGHAGATGHATRVETSAYPPGRSGRVRSAGDDNAGMRNARELHEPHWYSAICEKPIQAWLVCYGCDAGPYADGPPAWPCRTAKLVYSEEEIAAREPQVPECPEDHRTGGEGPPVPAPTVFIVRDDGGVEQRRWMCDHVAGVPLPPDFDPAWEGWRG